MILVTGATENIGRNVVRLLLGEGEKVRVLTRDPKKVEPLGSTVDVCVGDLCERGTLARALDGVRAAFLINFSPAVEIFRGALDDARPQSRARIVFLSSILATSPELKMGRMHKDKEDVLCGSGFAATFVRPGPLMSNSYQWARSIKAEGVVYNPMGGGLTTPMATEDVAAMAALALRSPDLPEAIELTGGELISVTDQVRILASVLGVPIKCIEVPEEAATQNLLRAGVPGPMAAAIAESFAAVRSGQGAKKTDPSQQLLGRRPTTFESWAKANAQRFA